MTEILTVYSCTMVLVAWKMIKYPVTRRGKAVSVIVSGTFFLKFLSLEVHLFYYSLAKASTLRYIYNYYYLEDE